MAEGRHESRFDGGLSWMEVLETVLHPKWCWLARYGQNDHLPLEPDQFCLKQVRFLALLVNDPDECLVWLARLPDPVSLQVQHSSVCLGLDLEAQSDASDHSPQPHWSFERAVDHA